MEKGEPISSVKRTKNDGNNLRRKYEVKGDKR